MMGGLIAEAAARGQVGLELVSVDSTIVRAHQESSGLAVSGEVLDALEVALTGEKGVPLDQQVSVLRVRRRFKGPTRRERTAIRRTRSVSGRADGAKPGHTPPDSATPEAD